MTIGNPPAATEAVPATDTGVIAPALALGAEPVEAPVRLRRIEPLTPVAVESLVVVALRQLIAAEAASDGVALDLSVVPEFDELLDELSRGRS